MFDVVWTSDNKVVAVRPRAELGPFFQVSEHCQEKVCLATPTGFEPAISALTGQCVKPLHHGAASHLSVIPDWNSNLWCMVGQERIDRATPSLPSSAGTR